MGPVSSEGGLCYQPSRGLEVGFVAPCFSKARQGGRLGRGESTKAPTGEHLNGERSQTLFRYSTIVIQVAPNSQNWLFILSLWLASSPLHFCLAPAFCSRDRTFLQSQSFTCQTQWPILPSSRAKKIRGRSPWAWSWYFPDPF